MLITAIASFSNPMAVSKGVVTVWPAGFELASCKKVIGMDNILLSCIITAADFTGNALFLTSSIGVV